MSILAVVTLYFPDIRELSANIDSYADCVDRILLWRNSPVSSFAHPKVELCGDCTNQGLPAALNYAWHYAEEHSYDWILTMDQDTRWVDFRSFLGEVSVATGPRGIYIPGQELITSGTLQSTETVRELGGWREDFFIDGVDFDYEMRARRAGINIYRVGAGSIDHHLGSPQSARAFGKTFTTANYAPYRLYDMYRNHWIVIRSYPEYSARLKKRTINSYKARIPRIILGEKQVLAKIWAIIKGTFAGLTYKIS